MGCLPSTVGRNTRQRPGAVQRQTRKISGSHRRWTLCVGDYRFPLCGLSQILQAVQRRGNQTHQEGDRPPSQRMERNEAHNGRDQQRSSDARHCTPMLHAGGSSEPTSSIRLPRMLPLPRRSLTYYDPKVHCEVYHNDNPFVLTEYTERLTICRGCNSKFNHSNFVISNREWCVYDRRASTREVFYHCNTSCILPQHPYFKSCEVTANPKLALKLTVNDIELLRRDGIDLSFCVVV